MVSIPLGVGIIFISYKILKELKLNTKWSVLSAILLFLLCKESFYIDYNFMILFIVLLIIYIEIKYKNSSFKYNFLIGFLAGVTILLKQSIGICVFIVNILYIILERRDKETIKIMATRLVGGLVVCVILLIYLFFTNSINSFIDYCILGIRTFSNHISYMGLFETKDIYSLLAILVPIELVMLAIIVIKNIKNKDDNQKVRVILFAYSIAQFVMVYPISDKIHFTIASYPAILILLYYVFKDIQKTKNIKVSIFIEHFMNVITLSIICILVLQSINDLYIWSIADKTTLNHFKNLVINYKLEERIKEVDDYIKDEDRNVYILDSEAAVYMIPLSKYNKDFDMFLKGNLGSKGEEGQIEKIKTMRNAVILIKNEKMQLNWQTPKEVLKYVRNNLEKVGEINIFDIYVTETEE